jgi:hypothetical protein
VTTAQLLSIDDEGGQIEIVGTLDNTGATLDIGAGTALGTLLLSTGTILGGVVQDFGDGLRV